MKKISKMIFLLLAFSLMSSTCEPEDEPVTDCQCEIEGTKLISFDSGVTWQYNGTDERSGMSYPCSYDNTDTNQRDENGTLYKIHWECRE